jgi:nitric oxide reductase subunit B
MQQPMMIVLKWLRTIGDVIFAVGIVATAIFVFKLTIKKK